MTDYKTIDADTFEELWKENYMQLYYFAFDIIGDSEVSKDIVSDVFAYTWTHRQEVRLQNIKSYFHICVRNKCLDHLRLNKRLASDSDVARLAEIPMDDDAFWLKDEERINAILREIDKMSPKIRLVLREHYFNKLTYKELAEMLDMSVNGIRKIIIRAFVQIRQNVSAKKSKK
jgi:RNA polymerase sigma factor (sigma-70 family)